MEDYIFKVNVYLGRIDEIPEEIVLDQDGGGLFDLELNGSAHQKIEMKINKDNASLNTVKEVKSYLNKLDNYNLNLEHAIFEEKNDYVLLYRDTGINPLLRYNDVETVKAIKDILNCKSTEPNQQMNKFILYIKKGENPAIYECNTDLNLLIKWDFEKTILEHDKKVCNKYCKYGYIWIELYNDCADKVTDEEFEICDSCWECKNFEFLRNEDGAIVDDYEDELEEDEINEIKKLLRVGTPISVQLMNNSSFCDELLANPNSTYLGEFYDIVDCRVYTEKIIINRELK